jgi:hypothetical protein
MACCRLYVIPALTEMAQEQKNKPQAYDLSPSIMEALFPLSRQALIFWLRTGNTGNNLQRIEVRRLQTDFECDVSRHNMSLRFRERHLPRPPCRSTSIGTWETPHRRHAAVKFLDLQQPVS